MFLWWNVIEKSKFIERYRNLFYKFLQELSFKILHFIDLNRIYMK